MSTNKPSRNLVLLLRTQVCTVICALALGACGGGGGGSNNTPAPTPPAPTPPTVQELSAASQFGAQATFGLPFSKIESLAAGDKSQWLDAQFSQPISRHTDIVNQLVARRNAGEFTDIEDDIELLIAFRRYAWWHRSISASDELRQRIAFALSEIFVVSDNVDTLIIDPYALSTYYDLLLEGSFGNFRQLLSNVTLHPAMGVYLSHINNKKSDPVNNTFPDENFAREIMQLFSIGLFELNDDGSHKLDSQGQSIPTYGNNEIREFAKIFTGLTYDGDDPFFGNEEPNFLLPMVMLDEFHEPGSKQLLNGAVVPDGQTGVQDIDAAIDNLFNHPNVGPFIGHKLIQRLVTSNPSPEYIERVSLAFNDNGAGVRGDMRAVIRAVLLDAEADNPTTPDNAGKLREPIVRFVSLIRQLEASSSNGSFFNDGFFFQELTRQHPLSSPSVFNFFLPDHSPAGALADAGLVAPEFQITTSTTIAGMTNLVDFAVNGDFLFVTEDPFGEVTLNYASFEALADDPDALIERLNILFTFGQMDDATKDVIRGIISDVDDMTFRTRTAIYLFLVSPDYAVRA